MQQVYDGISSIAISCYAHDEEVTENLVINGFGIRCSDAILDVKLMLDSGRVNTMNENHITYCELKKEEYRNILELKKELVLHLSQAPCCFPTPIEFLEQPKKWKEHRIFVALM